MKVTDELIQQKHCVISLSVCHTCAVFLQGFLKETAKTSERALQCGRSCLITAETLISCSLKERKWRWFRVYFLKGKKNPLNILAFPYCLHLWRKNYFILRFLVIRDWTLSYKAKSDDPIPFSLTSFHQCSLSLTMEVESDFIREMKISFSDRCWISKPDTLLESLIWWAMHMV